MHARERRRSPAVDLQPLDQPDDDAVDRSNGILRVLGDYPREMRRILRTVVERDLPSVPDAQPLERKKDQANEHDETQRARLQRDEPGRSSCEMARQSLQLGSTPPISHEWAAHQMRA